MKKLLCVLAVVSVLGGCAVTGPAEDQWDQEEKQDKLDLGKLLERGKQSVSEPATVPAEDVKPVPAKSTEYQEFLEYQEWKKSRQGNNADYREFKEFQQWKKMRERAQ